jgi:ribosomal protein L39E
MMDFSTSLFKELRKSLAARAKKKRHTVPVWIRSTNAGDITTAS